jgi:thiamine-monophosphate kinase
MPSEFDIIRRYFTRATPSAVLGVGDDAALLQISDGMELAISVDMLVADRHFLAGDDARALGHKALAVNLSDMAAMGATPRWVTMAIALPEADERWVQRFADGFFALAAEYGVELIGGDLTRGPLNICVQIMGEVPQGKALLRSGAQPGDDTWVSGTLGDAALALAHLQQRIELAPHELAACLPQLHTPSPRVNLGEALRGVASAAIDVSDGLLGDFGHILERSGAGAMIRYDDLPRSQAMKNHMSSEVARNCLLAGGDDYELCFCAPQAKRARIEAMAGELDTPLTRIGSIEAGSGLKLIDGNGKALAPGVSGFDHFG